MGKEMRGNVSDEGELEELEMLLNEIPQATSHNQHYLYHWNPHVHDGVVDDDDHGHFVTQVNNRMCSMYDDETSTQIKCASSPVSGFSLQSDGSSSSLFSIGDSTGSPTTPTLEDLKSTVPSASFCHPNRFWLDSMTPNSTIMKKNNESFVDELGLCANLSKMYISNQQGNPCNFNDFSMGLNRVPILDCPLSGNSPINVHKQGEVLNYGTRRGYSDFMGVQSPLPRSPINHDADMNSGLSGLTQDYAMPGLYGSRHYASRPETLLSQLNGSRGSMDSPRHRGQMMNNYYCGVSPTRNPAASVSRNPMVDSFLYAQKNGMNFNDEMCMSRLPSSSHCTNLRPYLSVNNFLQNSHSVSNSARAVLFSNARIPLGNIDATTTEESFILQGEGLNYVTRRGSDRSRCHSKPAMGETGFTKRLPRSDMDRQYQAEGTCENPRGAKIGSSFPLLPKYNSLAEARGYVYLMAKDQHGCRFLQKVFDEGTPEDVQVIFSEIIDHVVELMVNPFGNYLMQKMLDVCNEEQRTHILLIVTKVPGQLVRISLNTHGTRVVQKLIETLRTRQQISLVVSALEPGFLALIKDLNGNHVVQRCLLCLSNEDNKFIFAAATKYCVEIATHQHGCCVLQRCIGHSSGEHQEKLIAEISANAFPLAQDQFGNYVVQFILDLRIPSAMASIGSQFEGNYVHLSRHKFGSHVVEKCLALFSDENRSRIIHELLAAPHFVHLLQDPYANYVVHSALRYSEGRLHNLLVEAILSHKAISQNSPYSRKIFSQKLLKK